MSRTVRSRLDDVQLRPAVKRLVTADEAEEHPATGRIRDRAREYGISLESSLPDRESPSVNRRYRLEKQTLLLRINRGSFIKPWESPPSIVGRDEWCLTPVEGCPLDCSYCYLQDYLERPLVQAFVNQGDIAGHVREFLDDPPEQPPHFFSLGELSDGLFLEPILRTLPRVWDLFRSGDAKLEVRTKSHHVHGLNRRLDPHPNGVFTWSLSPAGRDRRNEMLTAPVDQRLAAMRHMHRAGFRVAARLDPILLQGDWLEEYTDLLERMNRYLSLEDLTFLLVGTFRFPRGFDRTMQQRFPNRTFLRDEFVEGPDGKLRYPRGRRTRAFRALRERIRDVGGDPKLCMEPPYVWEDAGYR